MITCVVPRELADDLYPVLVERYRDNPNVQVVVDRRTGPDRRARGGGGGKRVLRDRRRARIPGSFLPTDPPNGDDP